MNVTLYKCAEIDANGTVGNYTRISKEDYDTIQANYSDYFKCKDP